MHVPLKCDHAAMRSCSLAAGLCPRLLLLRACRCSLPWRAVSMIHPRFVADSEHGSLKRHERFGPAVSARNCGANVAGCLQQKLRADDAGVLSNAVAVKDRLKRRGRRRSQPGSGRGFGQSGEKKVQVIIQATGQEWCASSAHPQQCHISSISILASKVCNSEV